MKRCPICLMNIVEAYYDKHVSGHTAKSAEEHAKSVRAMRESAIREAERKRELERQRAIEASRPKQSFRYVPPSPSDLEGAVEALRDSLRAFPGVEFDSMLRELSRIKVDGSPKAVAEVQRFVRAWCSEFNFGKGCYEAGFDRVKDDAFYRIVHVADRVDSIIGKMLHVEMAETANELDFQIACIDAGCVPGLVEGCGKQALVDLRRELVERKRALLPSRDGGSKSSRFRG